MSPEQYEGKPVDVRSDIFSAGVLLQEMITGRSPFEGSPAAGVRRQLDEGVDLPSAQRERLDLALGRALAVRPVDRYDSAADFSTALYEALSANAEVPAPLGARSGVYYIRRRWRLIAAIVFAGVVSFGGFVAVRGWNARIEAVTFTKQVQEVPCARVSISGDPNVPGMAIRGLASRQAELELQRIVASYSRWPVSWEISAFDGPYCQALELLRLTDRAGNAARGLVANFPSKKLYLRMEKGC